LTLLSVFSLVVNPALAASGSSGLGTGPPDHVILSWTEDPLTSQTISWRGTDANQNRVQYVPAADFTGSFDGAQEAVGERSEVYEGYFHFRATLRGLTPDTAYVYRVGCEGAWSEPATFTTATSGDRFAFLYMGDVQEGHEVWGEMLQQIAAQHPGLKFALIGGDLVDQGGDVEEWQRFFHAAWPVFRRIPLMPAVGNHDDAELFGNLFAVPRNGPEGYEGTIYSFDYGNCHVVVLDSNRMGIPGAGDYERIAGWLQNDLAASKQRWKFVVLHHPPYPAVYDWRADVLQEHWVPLFEQGGVDMVFVGHQHVYMRTKPLRGGQVCSDGEGIVYVMGNAGTKYYGPGPDYEYIAEEVAWVSNYQVIDVQGDTLTMTARDSEGEVIDTYTVVKHPAAGNALYAISPLADAVYQIGVTPDGIATMTVAAGVSGMKYFGVKVAPVMEHEGLEAVVFGHFRSGSQLGLNVTKADFDRVEGAQAGFNVQPGDVIKVYIVDDLTNAVDRNPTLLQ